MSRYNYESVPFESLVGKTMELITKDEETIVFVTVDGEIYRMNHEQDCCESVSIEDICGDMKDLIGSPIVRAEERSEAREEKEDDWGTGTFTFYEIATNKGSVTIRWLGESNGYYSESVDFTKYKRPAQPKPVVKPAPPVSQLWFK